MYAPSVINGVLSLMAAAGLSYVVLHPKIHEGGFIKLGLVTMIISLIGSAMSSLSEASFEAAFSSGISLRIGLILVCVGYAFRFRRNCKGGHPTDFGSLTER